MFTANIFMWKHFLTASFHASMRSRMFYKLDVYENYAKFTEKRFHQILASAQMFSWKCFKF